jgi:hypothetical protein
MNDDEKALIDAAENTIKLAEKFDRRAVMAALEQSAVTLRGIVQFRLLPDLERMVYLRFLLNSVERILDGQDPKKALRLFHQNRPQSVNQTSRDFKIFMAIGYAYEQLKGHEIQSVEIAIKQVLKKSIPDLENNGVHSLRKAWQSCGGLKAWKKVYSEIRN